MENRRDLRFICAQPLDKYFTWQVHMWLESLKVLGYSDKATVLIFVPKNREKETLQWRKLQEYYPEAEFKFYKDEHEVTKLIPIYIPILRPYVLMRYFKDHPETKDKAVFYCDADVLFTKNFNVDKYVNEHMENDTCYLSDTLSYINADYFESKVKDVLPEKLEEYKKRDILHECCFLAGITKEMAVENNLNSGGAQYLLKDIDNKFWEDVITACIRIRIHLQNVNREFFANENKGFQSWCSDMWAVLWTLWKRGQQTKIVPEMEFAWSTDPIAKLDRVGIFHNAGISSNMNGETPLFYKGEYHLGKDPFTDPHLDIVYNNEKSKQFCNHFYVTKMIELRSKYNVNY